MIAEKQNKAMFKKTPFSSADNLWKYEKNSERSARKTEAKDKEYRSTR